MRRWPRRRPAAKLTSEAADKLDKQGVDALKGKLS
jgi:hypothetical protein